jgi:hypothetical protein
MAHHTANSFLLASSLATDKKTDKTMRGLQPESRRGPAI